MTIRLHLDAPDDLLAAIAHTYAETTFSEQLIEKDYYCSVALDGLMAAGAGLVFRGGTLLAKVYAGFTRLSEDLDFSISIEPDATRSARRRAIEPVKEFLASIERTVPGLRVSEPLNGHNENRDYKATLTYRGLDPDTDRIKIEVGLREPLLEPPAVHTLLRHWADNSPLVPPFRVPCMTLREALAEKVRAALTRRTVAIRDFYDVDLAVRRGLVNPANTALIELVRRKLGVPGAGPVDLSSERLGLLPRQVDAELHPVLRDEDAASFDLDHAIATVRRFAEQVRV